jgi:hypothetical protein
MFACIMLRQAATMKNRGMRDEGVRDYSISRWNIKKLTQLTSELEST